MFTWFIVNSRNGGVGITSTTMIRPWIVFKIFPIFYYLFYHIWILQKLNLKWWKWHRKKYSICIRQRQSHAIFEFITKFDIFLSCKINIQKSLTVKLDSISIEALEEDEIYGIEDFIPSFDPCEINKEFNNNLKIWLISFRLLVTKPSISKWQLSAMVERKTSWSSMKAIFSILFLEWDFPTEKRKPHWINGSVDSRNFVSTFGNNFS